MMRLRNKIEYLYLHVPFCKHICYYCDFTHSLYKDETAEKWLCTIRKELKEKAINPSLKTIYIGGGTPTSLSNQHLDELLTMLDPYSEDLQEYTIEINPETFTAEKAELLKRHHVNRASIGLQTSDQSLLDLLGRKSTYKDVCETVSLLKEHDILNISLDLMYSLPSQDMASLKSSIEDALALNPAHLSLYSLTIEPNTIFGKKGYEHLDDDTEADMYEYISAALKRNGYQQYEVSNFCKEGYESIHNSAYWNYRDFYGIGCGASGKEGFVRYDNTKNLSQYLKDFHQREEINLSEREAMEEMLMMSMRFKKGMNLDLFRETFQHTFQEVFGDKAKILVQQGLIEIDAHRVKCSDKGYEIMNSILVEFMD